MVLLAFDSDVNHTDKRHEAIRMPKRARVVHIAGLWDFVEGLLEIPEDGHQRSLLLTTPAAVTHRKRGRGPST